MATTDFVVKNGLMVNQNLNVKGTAILEQSLTLNGNLIFEGATANDFETTLAVTDPTADRTITFPNADGTVAVSVSDTTTSTQGELNLDFTLNAAGNISATGTAQNLSTSSIPEFAGVRSGDIVVRGGSGASSEGGQITIGYGNNTSSTITGQSNNSWIIDVAAGAANNDFRIFRQNSSGAIQVALQITESSGTITLPVSEVIQGNLAAWNTTTPGTGVGGLHLGAASATADAGPAITFGARDSSSGATAQAGIYVTSGGGFGTRMYLSTTDAYASGSKVAVSVGATGVVSIVRSTASDSTTTGSLVVSGGVGVGGNLYTGGNMYITNTGPVLVLRDTDSTGVNQIGYLSFQDDTSTERAWVGYGTTANDTFNIQNNYSGGLTFNGNIIYHAGNHGILFNNMGQTHGTRTSFDASTPSYDFGFRYVQGSTNGPGTAGTQFYSWYIGLGSEYPSTGSGSYGAMFAVDRNVTTPYLSVRYNESNDFTTWRKIAAGVADTWTNSRTLTIGNTGKSVNGGGDVSWSLSEIGAYAATNPSGFITASDSITGTSAGVVKTVTGTTSAELVRGNMGDNDQARILVGATASNSGFLEIATADDGTEPIHVRQYTGVFTTLTRTATLLDASGNTSFPGTVTAPTFSGALSGNATTATTAGSTTTVTTGGSVTTTVLSTGAIANNGTVTGQWTLVGASTFQATFADLAEWYDSDEDYESGTVLVFGGTNEVTIASTANDYRVAGVVTTNPAFIMNVDRPGPSACVTLQGKVPCKVIGQINKGDLLVSSNIPGYAMANNDAGPYKVIGKAMENKTTEEQGLIYISVGR